MKVAIEIHGTIRDGLWTAERGESRWAQNVAAVLARNGHEVDAFGSFDATRDPWGVCPRISGVTLKQWQEVKGVHYDVMLDTAWWDGKPLCPKADLVLIGSFWFHREVWNKDLMKPWPGNWRLVLPYAHNWAEFDVPENPHRATMGLLPYVLPNSRWWPQTGGRIWPSHRFFWGNKAAFGERDRWVDPSHPFNIWADMMLKVMRSVGGPAVVLGSEFLDPSFSEPAKHYDARARMQALPTATLWPTLPLGDVLSAMRSSALCLNLPWAGSVPLEAVFEGCCPLAWRGAFIPVLEAVCTRAEPQFILDAEHPDLNKLWNVVHTLAANQERRTALVKMYQQALEYLTPDCFMGYWKAVTS